MHSSLARRQVAHVGPISEKVSGVSSVLFEAENGGNASSRGADGTQIGSEGRLTLSHLTFRRLQVAHVKPMDCSFSDRGVGLPLVAGAMGTGCTLGADMGGAALTVLSWLGIPQHGITRTFRRSSLREVQWSRRICQVAMTRCLRG